ncbi:MAG TPA: ABC transporter ATP-binding protein [Bacteroidia bacterium]|nr:ABC transporter ATP-binding protein [Bacteroidia bacterium]
MEMKTDNDIMIEAKGLCVSFMVQRHGINNIKDFIITMGVKSPFEKSSVLRDLNLTVYKGECLGVMGRNGCGKSTLLRTIAGIMKPDKGSIKVNGVVAPLMALGVGLEPELSGYENIRLVGTLMGLSKKELKHSMGSIIEFSELTKDEIELQVKRYSSGMMARLAFSIAVATMPEILIIDEVLAVGDLGFRQKCANRINEIKDAGSTIIYVSHHLEEIKNICTRAIFMEDGRISLSGNVDEVCEYYKTHLDRKVATPTILA